MRNTYLYTKSTFPQSKQKPKERKKKAPEKAWQAAQGRLAGGSVETENVAQNTNRNLL